MAWYGTWLRRTIVVGLCLHVHVASASHVDLFDAGAFSVAATNGSSGISVTGIPVGSTLGGARVVGVVANTGSATASLGPTFNPGANDDSMTFSATGSASLSIGLGSTGPLHEDFLDMPNSLAQWDRIRVDFGAASSAASAISFQLFGTNGATLSLTHAFAGGTTSLEFLYSDLIPSPGFAVQDTLRDVSSVQFTLTTPANGGTYVLADLIRGGSVLAVPEPSTAFLLVLALALASRCARLTTRNGSDA